ncbi:MAG TPA: 3'-5' exonuclease [Actinomycetota bacterium]
MNDDRVGRPPPAPPAGSRRRPWSEVVLVALDFETTGLDLAADSVISWGTVPLTSGGIELRDAAYQLVAPRRAPGVESIRVHELRPVDLAGAPVLEAVAPSLHAALGGRFLVAWAAGIERAFLRRMFGGSKRSWRRRTIDVRDVLLAEAGGEADARRLTLEAACRRYGVPVERTHHAFDDALMTAELFLVLAARLGTTPTVRRLQRAAFAGSAHRR